ncbi:rhodanese-like domain-containing protein [Pukyongia salina]|uniref:Rhodanese-like domain-containing protein n=1 Tax=Pukyongia salina TaxID=2094025 RepID=A0A2S0HWH6_9FLAO|nr:rhodanese-like domain-containing protein [Pukyongia salina]AVI51041.1 rhodanese-like domain-containing protein [Pukyongia salina]
MKLRLVYIILFLLGLQSSAQESLQQLLNTYNTRSIPYISVEELRMLQLNDEVYILDAREFEEYEVSRIPGGLFIGFSDFSSEMITEKIPDSDRTIVVYCSLGIRSEEIGEKLRKAGYSNIRNLYGGIFEWKNNGYPIVDSEGNETEKVHSFSKAWSKWLTNGEKVYE